MKRKFLSTMLALTMVLTLLPVGALAEGEPEEERVTEVVPASDSAPLAGTVEGIGGFNVDLQNNTTEAVTVTTVEPTTALEWSPKNESIGRNVDGWWFGIKIVAPNGANLTEPGDGHYQNWVPGANDWSQVKSFYTNRDSGDATPVYMTAWGYITPEILNTAKASNRVIFYKWHFDWTNDGTYEQEIVLNIDPGTVKLNKDSVEIYPENASSYEAIIGGTLYSTLADAISAAQNGQTVTLQKDVTLTDVINIPAGKTIILDLGGKKLSRAGNSILDIYGNLTIQNGTIEMTEANQAAAVWVNQTAGLTVESNATVSASNNSFAIAYWKDCTTAQVELKGTLSGEGSGITMNGNIGAGTSNKLIVDGATIDVTGHGIYQAGCAETTFTVKNSTITGDTGIEVRAGSLTLDNSTVIGNGKFAVAPNGSGTTTDGVGLAIAQHTTKQAISVTVNGGTLSGTYAIYESNPQENSNEDIAKVTIAVTGGNFEGNEAAVYSQNKTGFITGGTYSSDPSDYVPATHMASNVSGQYIVGVKRTVTFNSDGGSEVASAVVAHGTAVAQPSAPTKSGYTFAGWYKDGVAYNFGTLVTEDITLTAKWNVIVYVDDTPSNTTTTEKNPDGSTTTTVKQPNGTVTETTISKPVTDEEGNTTTTKTETVTKKDGSTTETTTETVKGADGSSSETKTVVATDKTGAVTTTETVKATDADGTKTEAKTETLTTAEGKTTSTETVKVTDPTGTTAAKTTETDAEGKTAVTVEAAVSAKAAAEAAKAEVPVTLPVEVPSVSAQESADAPVVTVTLPSATPEKNTVAVEIPVASATAGTVAVLVKADGTEEIVKTSTLGDKGVVLILAGDTTVKIVDNTKYFNDVQGAGHWAGETINFVAAREIFNGTGNNTFSPDERTTRAMVMTVLARYDGEDTTGGDTWYAKAMDWAKDNGVSDGTSPDADVTREQLATMLYRYAGSPKTAKELTAFPDGGQVNGYAVDAMGWAVENGLIGGTDKGTLDPQGSATRAEVAAVLARFCAARIK